MDREGSGGYKGHCPVPLLGRPKGWREHRCPHPPYGKVHPVARDFLYTGWTSGRPQRLRRSEALLDQSHQGTSRTLGQYVCGLLLTAHGGRRIDEHPSLPQGQAFGRVWPHSQAHIQALALGSIVPWLTIFLYSGAAEQALGWSPEHSWRRMGALSTVGSHRASSQSESGQWR
ncbi:hypothetical protein EWB00_000827 [Schistosoma japonicum]|uniref:Uncharacterized protein n=1 Tax=Schistosoma japonicum TaxID=6182 RepID=A0A4Z2CK66_SCHJA|nr:hypothetical protein EWB00_000827 [Schistosoma japonicum]